MRRVIIKQKTRVTVNGVIGFLKRTVTKFGNGAKVDCPKEYIGKEVYLIIKDD
jgi:putative transposon-encoded protein